MTAKPKNGNLAVMKNKGFLNYMRVFCKKHSNKSTPEALKLCSKAWEKLSWIQKKRYRKMKMKPFHTKSRKPRIKWRNTKVGSKRKSTAKRAKRRTRKKAPMRIVNAKKKRKVKARSKSGKRLKGQSRSRPKLRRRFHTVTSDAYLNFLTDYSKKHSGLQPGQLVKKVARAWCRLPLTQKEKYHSMALKVKKYYERRNRLARLKKKKEAEFQKVMQIASSKCGGTQPTVHIVR